MRQSTRSITDWALIVVVSILAVSAISIGAYYQNTVMELKDRQVPDSAFVMTCAVIAEAHDRDGNLVDKVEKWGDLPTKNWGYLFAAELFASQRTTSRLSEFNNTVMKDTTGTLRDIDKNDPRQADIVVTYPRIGWGTGATAATIDDYELTTKDDWDTVDGVVYYVNSTHMWVRLKMTHEFTTAIGVTEIGLYLNAHEIGYGTGSDGAYDLWGHDGAYAGDMYMSWVDYSGEGWNSITVGDSLGRYLCFRDVLPSTLNVAADTAMTVTYWLYFQYA